MSVEQTRSFLRTLPHTAETMQWGANLVYWVGDKAAGGKMFALMDLDEDRDRKAVLAFYAGPERFAELLEIDGILPAPYLARAYWVAVAHWDVLTARELQSLLVAASNGVLQRLPKRTRERLLQEQREHNRQLTRRKREM